MTRTEGGEESVEDGDDMDDALPIVMEDRE